MTIRPRVLVAIVAVVLALVGLYLYHAAEQSRRAAMEAVLTTFVESPAFSGVRAQCQADPAGLRPVSSPDRDAPPFEVYAYDGEFHPANPASPEFPTALADKMRGKISEIDSYKSPDGAGVEMGIATPWRNGNCALMLVRHSAKRGG